MKEQIHYGNINEPTLDNLRNETEFFKYIDLLKCFSKRYTVIFSTVDTPVWESYTSEISKKVMDIGFKTDLCNKYRLPYIGIVDEGKSLFEKLGKDFKKSIRYSNKIGFSDTEIISAGYYSADKLICEVTINGKIIMKLRRGLNIVVFDKITGFVLDAINFDTFEFPYTGMRKMESIIEKNPFDAKDVVFIPVKSPVFPQNEHTNNEKLIADNVISRYDILAHYNNPDIAINKYYSKIEFEELLYVPKSYHDENGARRFYDYRSRFINTVGGHRITMYQPEKFKRTIFLVGGCTVFGIGSDDSKTISSFLQVYLNNISNNVFIVQNYGYFLAENDRHTDEISVLLNSLPVKRGDIVLCFAATNFNCKKIDCSELGNNPKEKDIFWDLGHYTPYGNGVIAEKIFEELLKSGLLKESITVEYKTENSEFKLSKNKELAQYQKILLDYYKEKFAEPIIGSIVMNCNPFTLGHRYLIEQAFEQCDFLMIFVVQEDKSMFPFDDRLKLVEECTADIMNKEIIPSGKFIISSLTFSEYFNKSEMQDRTVDTSLDVTVFARDIAPCLHITKRFAGEEPFDNITRQYNDTMRQVLPEYGIEFVEIPRAQIEGEVISASKVRELLNSRNFEKIRELVPEPTYNYLMEKYN